MSVNATASVKLADRIPNQSQMTDLVGQLKTQVSGVQVPGLPLDQIQKLTAGFDLKLPDTTNWHTAIPGDVHDLLKNFPTTDTLARPLEEPLTKIKDVFSFDFMGELTRIEDGLKNIPPLPSTSPDAMLDGLLVPLDEIAKLLQDPALKSLLDILSSLLGIHELEEVPQTAAGLIAQIKPVLHDRVEGLLLAFLTLGSVMTATDGTERVVGAITGAFSLESTEARFQALLAQYGDGANGLAGQVGALNPADAAQVAAVRAHLQAANDAFSSFTGSLVRDMAFTEASLAMLNSDAVAQRFQQLAQTLSRIDANQLSALADSLQALLHRAKDALKLPTDLTMEQYKSLIHTGMSELNNQMAKFDPAAIDGVLKDAIKTINEPFQKLEDFKAEVESIVRGAFQTVSEAIDKIDLKPLQTLAHGALGELEAALNELDALFTGVRSTIQSALDDVKKALDGVRTFVLDPNTGLKKKIDEVFHSLNQLLAEVNLKAVADEISAALQPISSTLVEIQFTPIMDATVQAMDAIAGILKTIGPLLVTDALKQKLAEATDFLRKLDLDAIGKTLTDEFQLILQSVDVDALGKFKEEYQTVVQAIDQLDPAPPLNDLQHEVFDPLVTQLEQIKPAELLKPVQDGYNTAFAELSKFSPADSFAFITAFFDDLLAQFHSISPAKLLAPIAAALNDVRAQINRVLHVNQALDLLDKLRSALLPLIDQLDLSPMLQQMSAGYAEMKTALAAFDPHEFVGPLANVLDSLFGQTGTRVNESGLLNGLDAIRTRGDLGARFSAMQTSLQHGQTSMGALDVRGRLATLRSKHAEVTTALGTIAAPANLTVQVDLLNPMPVLAPLLPKIDRVNASYAAQVTQFGQVVTAVAPTFQALGKVLDIFQALLSPLILLRDMLLTPLHQLFPDRTFTGTKDVLLAFLEQMDPAQWQADIQQLTATGHTKLKALFDDAVFNPIAGALQTIEGMVNLLSIQALTDAITGVFAEVEAKIQAFNPAPIIKALNDDYRRILATLQKLNPADFIKEIDQVYAQDILGVVQAISPEKLLLPPLEQLFAEIKGLLVAIDIEALFKPVLDHLRALDGQLGDGLHHVEGSYTAMLDALTAATGTGSASISASVSVGG